MTEPLPPGWALADVGSISNTQLGKTLNRSKQTGDESLEYLRNVNIRWGSFDLTDLKSMDIPPEEFEQFTVQEGDLLLTEGGEPGRCAVWNSKEVLGFQNALHRIRPVGNISPTFLRYQFEWLTKTDQLSHLFSGVTIKHFSQSKLRSVTIRIAPIPEQKRIVATIEEHFSRIDATESAAQTALVRLDTLSRAILTAAFTGHLVKPQNPRRTPDGLPEDWSLSTVGDVSDVQLGRQRSPDSHFGPHMRPYIRAANVTWSGLDLSDIKEMNFDPSEATNFQLRVGDIVLNEASGSPNEVGKPAIWRGEIEHCFFQNTLLRVRTRGPLIDFLYWHFYYLARLGKFGEAGRGVNIRHLGKQGLTSFPIIIAPLHDQKQIVAAIEEQFSRIDSSKAALERCLQRCNILRRSILAAAFSGQLAEHDPDDEPASVLLERIAAEQPKRHTRSKSV